MVRRAPARYGAAAPTGRPGGHHPALAAAPLAPAAARLKVAAVPPELGAARPVLAGAPLVLGVAALVRDVATLVPGELPHALGVIRMAAGNHRRAAPGQPVPHAVLPGRVGPRAVLVHAPGLVWLMRPVGLVRPEVVPVPVAGPPRTAARRTGPVPARTGQSARPGPAGAVHTAGAARSGPASQTVRTG